MPRAARADFARAAAARAARCGLIDPCLPDRGLALSSGLALSGSHLYTHGTRPSERSRLHALSLVLHDVGKSCSPCCASNGDAQRGALSPPRRAPAVSRRDLARDLGEISGVGRSPSPRWLAAWAGRRGEATPRGDRSPLPDVFCFMRAFLLFRRAPRRELPTTSCCPITAPLCLRRR